MKYLITTIVAILLIGCGSSPDHSGTYTLTISKLKLQLSFELKPDGSFIGKSSKQPNDDLIGSWKVEDELLVCNGTPEISSDKVIAKFNKTTGKVESFNIGGRTMPIEDEDSIYFKKN